MFFTDPFFFILLFSQRAKNGIHGPPLRDIDQIKGTWARNRHCYGHLNLCPNPVILNTIHFSFFRCLYHTFKPRGLSKVAHKIPHRLQKSVVPKKLVCYKQVIEQLCKKVQFGHISSPLLTLLAVVLHQCRRDPQLCHRSDHPAALSHISPIRPENQNNTATASKQDMQSFPVTSDFQVAREKTQWLPGC